MSRPAFKSVSSLSPAEDLMSEERSMAYWPLTFWAGNDTRNVAGPTCVTAVAVIGPAGPTNRTMSARVNVVGSMDRSNVRSRAVAEALRTRLSAVAGWPETDVDTRCGPAMISGWDRTRRSGL